MARYGDSLKVSVIIPTLGTRPSFRRVLDRLDAQVGAPPFEAIVAVDAVETADVEQVDAACADRSFPLRMLRGTKPGASANRNLGWQSAAADLVLFLDDDVLPDEDLVAQHIASHDRHQERATGVLGHVRWADEMDVTVFMRWLERGIQFDYPGIEGDDAGWGRFYTANASVKRAALEAVGGFDEDHLPFGYEDLDVSLRMHEAFGFRLLYNRRAQAEHVHEMDLDYWLRRMPRIAVSERAFCARHTSFKPYFYEKFSHAASLDPAGGRGIALAGFIPPALPVVGPYVWGSVDAYYTQALAPAFLDAWEAGTP